MSKITDRYASAIHASSLKSAPETTWSDTDVLGAMGIAGKHEPLGAALARMLSGGGTGGVIDALTDAADEDAEDDARDAKRYRWLRDVHIGDDPWRINLSPAAKDGLDAAIDSAIAQAGAA